MKIPCRQRETCRLCHSHDLRTVLDLAATPPANAFVSPLDDLAPQETFPLRLMFCNTCTHVQLGHVVDPSILFENYVYVSGTSPAFRQHFSDYAASIFACYPQATDSLAVDIGSNDGVLLSAFRDLGLRIQGVDPAVEISRNANENGIPTLNAFFSENVASVIKEQHGLAAIVTANNVMAHIDDLSSVVTDVRTLLAIDGLFCFEVSYLLDVFEQTLFDTIYHEHLDYHTVAPLVGFLARHGLTMIAAERVPSHGGSIRIIAQRDDGPHPITESVATMITAERQAGLDDPKKIEMFAAHIETLKQALCDVLIDKKAQGRRIFGYGAPAKATTLMYQFGLGKEVLDCIIDDSPLKQGLASPGLHIPVVSSKILDESPPDDVLILAWNFADPIVAKLKPFVDQGGHIIVPLPNLKVITK